MNKKEDSIVYYNNPILSQKCEKVEKIDTNIIEFSNILISMMIKYDGIGLAANQIGSNKCIVAIAGIEPFNSPTILINPKIVSYINPIVTFEEGCLSFPKLYLSIDRPEGVIVEYQDLNLNKKTIEAHELLSRVLQHEIDHINGVRFIDRISQEKFKNIEAILDTINRRYNA
ncbi:MAG: peptide deformylase [Spirochaetales bacterium]|nr:peptide deformylase [Spirochaetales bacterium]